MLARAVLMLGLILLPSTSAIIHPPGSLTEMDLTVDDAGTVLYEEITATWCEICSLIDPLLEEVDHRQGSRMHRVALHPVGSDPLGTSASQHRIDRIADRTAYSNSTPAHILDGDLIGEGGDMELLSTVQRGVLERETARGQSTDLRLTVGSEDGDDLRIETEARVLDRADASMITLMVTQNQIQVEGKIHQRVLIGLIEVDVTTLNVTADHLPEAWRPASTDIDVEEDVMRIELSIQNGIENIDDLGFLVVHERVNADPSGATVLGVASLDQRDLKGGEDRGAGFGVGLLIALGLASAVIPAWTSRLDRKEAE